MVSNVPSGWQPKHREHEPGTSNKDLQPAEHTRTKQTGRSTEGNMDISTLVKDFSASKRLKSSTTDECVSSQVRFSFPSFLEESHDKLLFPEFSIDMGATEFGQ